MAVRCSQCGEELLGPVNRCWKCGQTFTTLPEAGGLPPVRRESAPAAAPVIAATAASVPVAEVAQPAGSDAPLAVATTSEPVASGVRTGSPFAPGIATTMIPAAGLAGSSRLSTRPKPTETQYLIRDQVAVAGAIGSLVLGGFGLAVSWMQNPTAVIGGALIAILGLGMGMWGLHSKRRGWALFGMLVCVAAISVASYSGAMILYQMHLEAKELEGLIE